MQKTLTPHQALIKAQKYCAYQERCHKEIRTKLLEWGVKGNNLESIISQLISDNFLNEQRFAEAFVRGKFNIKKWGKRKILFELKSKDISDYCIKKGMAEIDEVEYLKTLEAVYLKKRKDFQKNLSFEDKGKIANYLSNRGFESELVWEIINHQTTS